MLPSGSRVSPITYHSVVAVRYPDLCRYINSAWELGSFASGGIPSKPPGFQFVLWDTNARINGLVAVDLETLVSQVLSDYPPNAGFANGVFIMTTATDHKNNLNSSALKKNYARTLRVKPLLTQQGPYRWGIILPNSSRVSFLTYKAIVAVRYPEFVLHDQDPIQIGHFVAIQWSTEDSALSSGMHRRTSEQQLKMCRRAPCSK